MTQKTQRFKLNKIFGGIYVFLGATNVGVIATQKKIKKQKKQFFLYFIDAGESKECAKQIFLECERVFGKKNFFVKAIIATHSHADHMGGASWLVKKTGCKIWATQEEKCEIENPKTQGAIIWGGFPVAKFFEPYYFAKKTFVDKIIYSEKKENLKNGICIKFIFLPGHYMQMMGILVKNSKNKSVFFMGDGIFGRKMLAHYWMPFLYDVKSFKQSLKKIAKIKANRYIPSHGEICTEISALSEFNLISTISNEKALEKILKTPHTWEELLKEFADKNNIPLALDQYALIGSTIRSYLSYLCNKGKAKWFFKNNFMYWVAF